MSARGTYAMARLPVVHLQLELNSWTAVLRQRSAQAEAELARIIDSFERWHAARAVLQLASFAGTVVGLASLGRIWN